MQSGGASQTAAATDAGGRTQLANVAAALLVLLTGAVLAPLFEDLPQPTLAAIVIVAVTSFFRVDELRRFAGIRRSALGPALVALVGVLVLGVLPGLVVAAGLSLALVVHRFSRPPVRRLPDRAGAVAVRVDGPLFYANAVKVKDHVLALVRDAEPRPRTVELELDQGDIDVEALDMLGKLAGALAAGGAQLRLTGVHEPVLGMLRRSGLAELVGEPQPRR